MLKNLVLISVIINFFLFSTLLALEEPGKELEDVGLATELGAQVDGSLVFSDSSGNKVTLSELALTNRPMVLVPVYYSCP